MDTWKIGLASWIIQDGNYGDFRQGGHYRFALEFYPVDFSLAVSSTKNAEWCKDAVYKVTGEAIYLSDEISVLDVGQGIYREGKPNRLDVGEFISATIHLGIDPFFYFERLCKIKGVPPLIYAWEIRKIFRQTAPFIEIEKNRFARDEAKWGWMQIPKTDAWHDDNGNAEYILECERMRAAPLSHL